jgi:formate dehydrogenase
VAQRERKTYCRICEAACGLAARVRDGRVTALVPDRSDPISRGFACAKGTRFAEVAYHRERLLEPRLRDAHGDLRAATWDEAYALVGSRIADVQHRHGRHAVGLYFGNPIAFNAQAAATLPAFTKVLGTRNVFSAGSQDCNNKFAGARLVYGSPIIQPFPDVDRTDLAVILGSNPFVSQGSFVHLGGGATAFQRLVDRGGHVIWIDPRRTESAERWGEHQPIRPGTDAFLLSALLARLAPDDTGIPGMDELVTHARRIPLELVTARTGIAPERLDDLVGRIDRAPRTAFHMSVGVNQGGFGTLCYVLLQALARVTGNFDRPGGLLVHPFAPPLAQGFSRAGLDEVRTSRVGAFDSNMGTLPAAIMADEILEPGPERIRAMIVIAGDPLLSVPGGERMREAFAALDLLVTIDMFENETGKLAHALLPTTSWLERWDLATTSLQLQAHGRLPVAGPVIPPLGSCRNDARILCELALRLGGSRMFHLGRLSWDRWLPAPRRGIPLPTPKARRGVGGDGHPRYWEPQLELEFGRLLAATPPDGFVLMGRRRRLGHNSWLHRGARTPPEISAWLHPRDLEMLDLETGELVTLRTKAASISLPVRAQEGVARGTVVVPHGLSEPNVNALFPTDAIERLSGMVTLTGLPVDVERGAH